MSLHPQTREEQCQQEAVSTPCLQNLIEISIDSGLKNSLLETGKIVPSVAHCIRNSLNAIKGAVFYLTEKYAEDDTIKQFMQIATDEIERIDEFISDLLILSSSRTRLIETDINELIKRLLFFTSFQFKVSNIDCQYEFGNLPAIRINPFELGQAILNVVNNSIEAMTSGGVLSIKTYDDKIFEKEFIILEISDTGPGIIQEQEPPDDATNSMETGRGLGLLITRKIIENHGGNLLIESNQGVGTSVCFCLPVHTTGGPNE